MPRVLSRKPCALNPGTCAAQVEAVDAMLRLFYSAQREEDSTVFSRTAEQKTLMMHYVLIVALIVENFAMGPAQVPPPARRCPALGSGGYPAPRNQAGAPGLLHVAT